MRDEQPAQQTPVTIETVRQMACAFPEVEERTVFGGSAFYVKKKFMRRLIEAAWRQLAPKRAIKVYDNPG